VAGIDLLSGIIMGTDKTVAVISHDESFLNSFTDNVLYLDNYSGKVCFSSLINYKNPTK
jgi:ATPase subunit of ABC transporter with duplicated ATPase domains